MDMPMKYGVLIVGAGWVSGAHISAFQKDPRAKIVAIQSRRSESAQAQIQANGLTDCKIYTDYAQALADPRVDIVVICTPNDLHCEQAILAAQAGKHLLIEKPAALCWEDAQRMAKEIEFAGVRSLVGYVLHFNSLFMTAKNLQEQFLGEIQYAETDYFHRVEDDISCYHWNRTKKVGGSSLLAGGCHAVDAMRWFMQEDVESVYAQSMRIRDDFEFPGTSIVLLRFRSGKIAKIGSSYDFISPYVFNLRLCGTKGTLWNDKLWSPQELSGQLDYVTLPVTLPNSANVSHHPFPQQASHLLDCIERGVETNCPMSDALKTQEVIAAADRSAQTGQPVSLPLR